MDAEGEVDRRGPSGQLVQIALGGENEDLVLEELDLEVFHELGRIGGLLLPVDDLAQPVQVPVDVAGDLVLRFVAPVRGDADFGGVVHLGGADLYLDILALGADYRGVQRLVHIALGRRDIVLDPLGDGGVDAMDQAEDVVALAHAAGDNAHRQEVVDFLEGLVARLHLVVDAVEVLGAAGELGLDTVFV